MSQRLALHWRLIQPRYNLVGSECRTCGGKYFPPRTLCSDCRRKGELVDYKFKGTGEVYSHTTVYAPPSGFEYQKPYVVAIIKLDEGPLVSAQVVDCKPEEVEVGTKVKTVFRKIMADGDEGIIRYGYKFKLA